MDYRIDLRSGQARQRPLLALGTESEFPTVDPRRSTRRNRYLTLLTADNSAAPGHGMLSSVSRYDHKRERLDTYRYPDTQLPEEHLFVPQPGSDDENEGWIVGTSLDFQAARTLLNVFEAGNLTAGPIASATLPYALPLGFHGKFAA